MTSAEEIKTRATLVVTPKEQPPLLHHDSALAATELSPPRESASADIPRSEKEESFVAFFDELWKNPLKVSPTGHPERTPTVDSPDGSDVPFNNSKGEFTTTTTTSTTTTTATTHKDEKIFCNPMMMMNKNHHELMTQQGVAPMSQVLGKGVGGDMSQGMIMYMDGFRFAMAGNQPCLNLYFPSWTLDTRWKFVGSLVLVFLLSFSTEGISKFRHTLSSRPVLGRERRNTRRIRQIQISALHGVQALLGYVVMLATMTFSVEILLSVVLGLSCGYYHYFAGEVGLEGHVTTNPCCSYMQNESDDQAQRQHQQQQQQQQQSSVSQAGHEDTSMTTSLLLACPVDDTAHV